MTAAAESSLASSAPATAVWRHDVWNLLALGCLNAVHILWWLGILSESALFAVFSLDVAYIALDGLWLVASPSCVPRRVWATLVAHHAAVLLCVPVAVGNPLLMRHLLRTWVVELHSWNHIAARRLGGPLASFLHRINKPLFVAVRLIAYPLTWMQYAADRATAAILIPAAVHAPLSCAHFLMYGLMLKWGHALLVAPASKQP